MSDQLLMAVPVEHGIIFALALFLVGLAGVMLRRDAIFLLMSLELMLNGAAFAFILGGAVHGNAEGQVMYVLILTLAAAEIAIALALVIQLYRLNSHLDMDSLTELRD